MKNRLILIITIIILSGYHVNSQSGTDTVEMNQTIVRLHILPPGITIEEHLKGNATVLFEAGLGFSFYVFGYGNEVYSDIEFMPYVAVEPRVYLTMQSRLRREKRVDYHSGIYAAFRGQAGFQPTTDYRYGTIGPLIGFQRTLGRKAYWSIAGGYGLSFSNTINQGDFTGDFKLGFIIN